MFKQIFGDPEAADLVFTSGADILAIGINITHQVVFTGMDSAVPVMPLGVMRFLFPPVFVPFYLPLQ